MLGVTTVRVLSPPRVTLRNMPGENFDNISGSMCGYVLSYVRVKQYRATVFLDRVTLGLSRTLLREDWGWY